MVRNPADRVAKPRRGRIAVRAPHAASRRCVVKGRYVPLNENGIKAARLHLAYLERDGVERDGSPGGSTGRMRPSVRGEFRAPLENEPRQFRFIVSPEEGDRLDLTEFARQFMRQVEKDTGRRLIWAAVNHHNTDNPHVHIVIRGVDRDGDELRIDGRYIGREMRWRAQEIVTRELGPRPEVDYSRQRAAAGRTRAAHGNRRGHRRARGRRRPCHDREIAGEPGPEGRVCVARLQVLETWSSPGKNAQAHGSSPMGGRTSSAKWANATTSPSGCGELSVTGRYRHRVIDGRNPTPPFDGVVAGKGLEDELAGTMFVAVMSAAGEACYLRVPPEIADGLRAGEPVRIGSEIQPWVRPADRIIARAAQGNGVIYDPVRHQQELQDLQRGRGQPGEPTPAERVAANVRRLDGSPDSGSHRVCRMAGGRCRPT